ncbi:DUF521 domain-containing protein [Candidatus Bathyarchaeota archaeon]|nr:DUF521 domain-containing protein [Candidatus Bathyarchaeota archaeon]NIR14391.1 DUF521 domain-containing protein [Desulfobacterales bacterium]NIU80999.1 DUF521 domain-containing protein [Candidatus Bathyarchaeota archaeon]NIV68405.1 DUF521 domain-containing protein [Candidatus Bathyarchaeota archaeon]NIW16530.1 DUF521 domain-containing protein [Candidatus Bathyarchaeota archaeon]
MYLTSQEESIYEGEYGWAYQVAIKILVRLGELFGATRLIPIRSAHVSGVSYKTLGEAPIDFFEALLEAGARAKVPTTANPSSFDPEYLASMFPDELMEGQSRIIGLYRNMGISPTLTCTPYYIHKPQSEWHLAWAESSASIYANSVLRAWTNRDGAPSALAAALIGKTPNYGLHQPENREAEVLIKVKPALKNKVEVGALGIHVGKLLKDEVPLLEGLYNPTGDQLKQLGAGLATSGMTPMFHYQEQREKRNLETITVEKEDIENTIQSLSTTSEPPDLAFIGCPHCSATEIEEVAQALEGKKLQKETELWVCTSSYVKKMAQKYVEVIENAGGHVLCDTCAVVTWIKRLGFGTLMTNSAKTAYYAPTFNGVDATLAPLETMLKQVTS